LLDKKLITMALYRLRGVSDNEFPYVFTNPDAKTIISHRDRAFVLGIEIPSDLQGDIYENMEREGKLDLHLGAKSSSGTNQHLNMTMLG